MATQSMPELEGLGLFVAVVEAGGFTAAARGLGLRKALVSRRVRELEARLGVQLLVRTTRSIRLTEEGAAYFEHARRAVGSAREAEALLGARRAAPTGVLRVSTTAVIAEVLLEAVIVRYLQKYPRVQLELDVNPRPVDLVQEAFDVAIRAGELPDSSLTVRRLGEARASYFGSPAYLDRHGSPPDPKSVGDHEVIVVGHGAVGEWTFVRRGAKLSLPVTPRLVTSSYEIALRAAVAGLGLVRLPDFFARDEVKRGRLIAVLQPWTPPAVPVQLVTPAGIAPPKTRRFVELVTKLGVARRLAG